MLKKILFVAFACVSIIGVTSGANALTVSYDCGTSTGAAPTDSTNYNSGDVVTVKPNTCTVPSGKHFAGYVCGSTNVAAGNTFTITENTTCTAQYENGKFAVKTTSTTTELFFYMQSIGTFTVDCGDNGVLSDDAETTTVSGNTITRADITEVKYTCTWASAGAHTITFDGTGTGYDANNTYNSGFALTFFKQSDEHRSIQVANAYKIVSISGSLYNLFPSTGTAINQIPSFPWSFAYTSITQIPDTLFTGYIKAKYHMFSYMFSECYLLTSIPENLFASLTSVASQTFAHTFDDCTALTSLPSGLFGSITSGENYSFEATFYRCRGLKTIPSGLFSSFIRGYAYLFDYTFAYCTGLTSIPSDLFANFKTGYAGMFRYTFLGCTGLTSLPPNLFSHFTSGADYMFLSTFHGCTGLSGYIPSSLFAGLIANNATYETDMMKNIFYNTGLDTSCDSYNGMVRYVTPYDEYWSSKVSCGAPINCTAGQYLPARTTTCATCTANNYCPSGSYGMNIVDQGLTACSSVGDNSYTISDAGATADTQCYKTCTIAHATTVTGNDYYGAGVDTCVATACEDGYSVSSDICTGNIITINWNGATAAAIAANNAGTAIYGGDIRTPQSIDPSQIPAGKHFVGWKFRKTPQG